MFHSSSAVVHEESGGESKSTGKQNRTEQNRK